jgi:hypothetical protein
MIIISQTYAEITPESVDDGDFSETGFVFEDTGYTFRELVDLMREHREPSQWPNDGQTTVWLSSGFDMTGYRTCTGRETSIHYSRSNPPRNHKYWRRAMLAAGIILSNRSRDNEH